MKNLSRLLFLCFFILSAKVNARQIKVADSVKMIDTVNRKILKDTSVAATPPVYVPYRYRNSKRRSPLLAAGLSIYIMGAGQVYNKQYLKAGAIVAVECFTFVGAVVSSLNHQDFFNPGYHSRNDANADFFLTALVADYVYSIVDAAVSANHLNEIYNLPRRRRSFTSLRVMPNVMHADNGAGKTAPGFSLVLR